MLRKAKYFAKSAVGLLFLLCLMPLSVSAEVTRFWKLADDHPLRGISATDIVAGPKGFVWLASHGGLFRYDGRAIKRYQYDVNAVEGLLSNVINTLAWDKQGYLWIGSRVGVNRFDPTTEVFQSFEFDGKSIYDLLVDDEGFIWFSRQGGGLSRLDPATGQSLDIELPIDSGVQINQKYIKSMVQDDQGKVWLATTRDGVLVYSPDADEVTHFSHSKDDTTSLPSNNLTHIFKDSKGRIWLGTDETSVALYLPSEDAFKRYSLLQRGGSKINVEDIVEDDKGDIWVTSWGGGVFRIDVESGQIDNFKEDAKNPYALPSNVVTAAYFDSDNKLWLSSYTAGIIYHDTNHRHFSVFQHNAEQPDSLGSDNVKAFAGNDNDRVWVATYGGGLNLYHRPSGKISHFVHDSYDAKSLSNSRVWSLQNDAQGDLWVGTSNGLNRLNQSNSKFTRYFADPEKPNALHGRTIFSLFQDSKNTLWIGTWYGGLSRYRDKTDDFVTYRFDANRENSLPSDKVKTIFEDSKGHIWIGTTDGLARKLGEGDTFKRYRHQKQNNRSLPDDSVNVLYEDNKGRLWVGTPVGAAVYNYQTDDFDNNLPLNALAKIDILGILQDDNDQFWFSSSNGVYHFDEQQGQLRHYTIFDGLYGNEASYGAFYKNADGRFFVGGDRGFSEFSPSEVVGSALDRAVRLTQVSVLNKPLRMGDARLPVNIEYLQSLNLSYQDYMFGFDFSVGGINRSNDIQYAYRLLGFDKQWINADNQHALYTNVPPGEYEFQVRAHNGDGVWHKDWAKLNISISPPWWQTWTFRLLVLVLAALTIYFSINYRVKQLGRRQTEQNKAKLNAALLAKKNALFAHVSHEFRTPLTLVIGSVNRLCERTKNQNESHMLQTAAINAKRILRMVDQLLDLARLDNQGDSNDEVIDFTEVAQFIHTSLHTLFEGKQIETCLKLQPGLFVKMPRDTAEKILVNLLSNAVKYTAEGGNILMSCEQYQDNLRLSVKDNGIGIAPEQQQRIFERFVRVYDERTASIPGAGIGLALVKELVERYGGDIVLHSEAGVGSEFIVTLPLSGLPRAGKTLSSEQNQVVAHELSLFEQSTPLLDVEAQTESLDIKPQILIVEDNKEMQRYIAQGLQDEYHCLFADNGEAGRIKALEEIPQLIITDLMMPKCNGFNMVKALRNDIKTSHIPVVMLTAKGDDQSKLEAWQSDIDEYMAKPFDQYHLQLRVRSLLNIRALMSNRLASASLQEQKSKTSTAQKPTVKPLKGISERDKQFIEKLRTFVENHYQDNQCKGKQLYEELAMTERQFHRKMQALLSQKFTDYLRVYRLRKGAEALRDGGSITEVAFECGFSSQNYFSLCFKAQYGISPSEYKSSPDEIEL